MAKHTRDEPASRAKPDNPPTEPNGAIKTGGHVGIDKDGNVWVNGLDGWTYVGSAPVAASED